MPCKPTYSAARAFNSRETHLPGIHRRIPLGWCRGWLGGLLGVCQLRLTLCLRQNPCCSGDCLLHLDQHALSICCPTGQRVPPCSAAWPLHGQLFTLATAPQFEEFLLNDIPATKACCPLSAGTFQYKFFPITACPLGVILYFSLTTHQLFLQNKCRS